MNKYKSVYIIVGFIFMMIVAIVVSLIPQHLNESLGLRSPNFNHLLGTDQLGRDFLLRLIQGSIVTIGLTMTVIVLSIGIGLILGLIAGIEGRWFDKSCMFLADLLLAIPSFIIALVVLSLVSDSMLGLLFALTIGWLGRYLRYFRNLTRDLQKQPFITYAVLSGNSKMKTTLVHTIPHLMSNILALITADIGKIMLSISGLAFLGLGIKPPTPELGTILFDGKSYFSAAPWLFFFPGLLLGGYALLFQMLNNKIMK
jgi:peptide/nickel transport system permease protein